MRLLSFPKRNGDQIDLTSPRMTLRRPHLEHFVEWAALRQRSADTLTPYEPKWSRTELTRSGYRARLRQQEADVASGRGCHWFLFAKDAPQALMGGISLTNIRQGIVKSGTLGYWMGQPYEGQHFMREAVACVVDHAFSNMELHRVEAATVLDNIASQRLLEACNFEREGLARAYLKINGQWRDHILFAKINPDHEEIRSNDHS